MIIAGCKNKPRPTAESSYIAQDGWSEYEDRGAPVRVPRWKRIFHIMSTECVYTQTTPSPHCEGCEHRKKEPA